MSEWSLDRRVQSLKRSLSYLQRRRRSRSSLWREHWVRGQSEGVCGSVGDCWKGLRVGSTVKHLWNSEVVGVQRMLKVSEVGVGKTLRQL